MQFRYNAININFANGKKLPGKYCHQHLRPDYPVNTTMIITMHNQPVRKIKVAPFLWHISRIACIQQIQQLRRLS